MNWRGGERDSFTNSLRCTTMQIFFSSLRSNAYEFDKTEMRFHLRKSVVTLENKNIEVNGTFIGQELRFQQTFGSRKLNSIIGKQVFKGKINSAWPIQCVM